MAGHSKWAKIHRSKGVADQKRANVFTKLGKAISVAVKEGGGVPDPGMNFKLRLAIEKARAANMPKANIERAIEVGAGKSGGDGFETGMYEGYAPAGVAVMVESVTDNKQRAYNEIRMIFNKGGGALAQPGAVGFLFDQVGEIQLSTQIKAKSEKYGETEKVVGTVSEDTLLEIMEIEDVHDVEMDDDGVVVICDPKALAKVRDDLAALGLDILEAELIMKPKDMIEVSEEDAEKIMSFMESLEDNDDVQRVFVNAQL